MPIQPFVENAIAHGLVFLEEKGLLEIIIFQRNEEVGILVRDNGIGRKKAMEYKNKSYKGYKSRGAGLVKNRLEI